MSPRIALALSCLFAPALCACGVDEASSGGAPNVGATPTPTPTPTPSPTPSQTALSQFGFSAIACDHDDPFDSVAKTDYSDEVQDFSNLNQVCPTGDIAKDRDRLIASGQGYDPLFYAEPVFFDPVTGDPRPAAEADLLWSNVQDAIAQSEIDPARIVFYLFDEPTLRGIDLSSLEPTAQRIRDAFPQSKLLLIEAFSDTQDPVVPSFVDLWGFNAYTVRDPAADARYTGFLDSAAAQLSEDQALVLIGDGIHTPFHAAAGLTETDMAEVARNYANLAQSRGDVAALLVYTWAGGIDNDNERGVRDLPAVVQDEWRTIGAEILSE